MKNIIIFDLDGVLIDSRNNMISALKLTNKRHNLDIKFSEYERYVGLPFKQILLKVGVKKNFINIKKTYSFYSNKKIKLIKFNKNVLKILKKLNTLFDLAIYTSKDKKRTYKVLGPYKKLFKIILNPEDVKKGKPNIEGLMKIKKFGKYNKENMFYIGDSEFDYLMAKKMKIKYFHVESNYKSNKLKNKTVVIKNFNQLLKVLTKYIAV